MSKDNGGPAFPTEHTDTSGLYDGMTLRDYFAAKAMQAMVATPTYENGGWPQDGVAKQAYEMADAMLLERNK